MPIYRISGAETGRFDLSLPEHYLLTNFLKKCWMNISEAERGRSVVEVGVQ